ncbi:MAG: hypothetical protein ACLPND_02615 [Candidatus Korobacteraceae bacterium]
MRRRVILAMIAALILLGGMQFSAPSMVSAGVKLEGEAASIAPALSAGDEAKPAPVQPQSECDLPQEQKSNRFAVIGDSGTGKTGQYQVAQQMATCRDKSWIPVCSTGQ